MTAAVTSLAATYRLDPLDEIYLQVPCLYCGAPAGHRCRNALAEAREGLAEATYHRYLHQARRAPIDRAYQLGLRHGKD